MYYSLRRDDGTRGALPTSAVRVPSTGWEISLEPTKFRLSRHPIFPTGCSTGWQYPTILGRQPGRCQAKLAFVSSLVGFLIHGMTPTEKLHARHVASWCPRRPAAGTDVA